MCVCVGGGGRVLFYVVVFNAIFSNSERNTKSFSCQGRIFLSTTFLTRIFSYNILKVNLSTSKRTQLQQKLEMSVSFVILS